MQRLSSPFDGFRKLGRRDSTPPAPPIITQTAAPTFGPYTAGQTPAGVYTAGTYASSAGTISSATPQWTINGVSQPGSTVLIEGDVVGLSVLVTDSVANNRTFGYGTAAPAGAAAVAAILSGLAYAADLISVTTDTASGTIYYLLHNSVTPLSGAAIKSAVVGLTAVGGGTLDPLETDNQPVDWTAVTPGTYWINMVQDTGVFSNVVSLEVTLLATFNPSTFADLVWDASNLSTLWQNTAGSTAVTTSGQSVARIDNTGTLGGSFLNTGGTDRPVYTESGGQAYLLFDGTDDFLEWAGTVGDIDFSGGVYMILGIQEITNATNKNWLAGAGAAGNSYDAQHGFLMLSGTTGSQAVWMLAGRANTDGVDMSDLGGSPLPLAVVEFEAVVATGSTNAWLGVRRVGDGDIVAKDTDAVAINGFPANATSLSDVILGAALTGGSPFDFANCRIYCGAIVCGTVTTQQRTDLRAWAAGKVGW
jgi:hypothetical protein